MTDYSQLSDADLNTAIAVRVCGWPTIDENTPYRTAKPAGGVAVEGGRPGKFCTPDAVIPDDFRPSTNLDDCFFAQSALAANGQRYRDAYVVLSWETIEKFSSGYEGTFLHISMDARARCIAMLKAVDAIEGQK